MAHFKFQIDLWVEGSTEKEAEQRMEALFDSEPLGEVELVAWECVCQDMTEHHAGNSKCNKESLDTEQKTAGTNKIPLKW